MGKEIAITVEPHDNNTNIRKWGYQAQKEFPMLKDTRVIFNGENVLQSFQDWEYEQYTVPNKNGQVQKRLRIKSEKNLSFGGIITTQLSTAE